MSNSTPLPTTRERLRALPSVDALLSSDGGRDLTERFGRDAALDALRAALEETRQALLSGMDTAVEIPALIAAGRRTLEARFTPTLRAVINATGVIIHTNLGRALLSEAAQQAVLDVAANYNTLEFDLENGKRGSRSVHAAELIREVTGAEAALVVNNNAAATVLMLAALAQGREVIVSRGQLVEIGGGFRVPDIMAQSGAKLVEVGTTNRTRATDFEHAITENTALLMRVHASNFKQIGFTEQPPMEALAEIARRHHLLLVDDLGSGALLDTAPYGLDHEPTVQESLAAGVDLVAFSGDKLLGGPQSGILAGRREVIDRLKQHPLARAIRADKLCLAALAATLDHYRRGEALTTIPVWQMISRPLLEIRETAARWRDALGCGSLLDAQSTVGGGSLPGATMPTVVLALEVPSADAFSAALRRQHIPVIARIAEGRVLFDPRTVLPRQEYNLLQAIRHSMDETTPDA